MSSTSTETEKLSGFLRSSLRNLSCRTERLYCAKSSPNKTQTITPKRGDIQATSDALKGESIDSKASSYKLIQKGNRKVSLVINQILKLNHWGLSKKGKETEPKHRKAINKVLMSLMLVIKCHKQTTSSAIFLSMF